MATFAAPAVVAVIVSFVMAPFRLIADQPRVLLPLSVALYVLAQTGMIQLVRQLEHFPPDGHRIPDTRWRGYTVSELNDYYDTLGDEGCRLYIQVANWDFFPYMPGYILPLGALHVMTSRQLLRRHDASDHQDTFGLVLVWIFDAVESFWQRRGCVLYRMEERGQLSDWQIQMASACVQLKFTVLIVSIVQLLIKAMQILRRQRAWRKRYHLPQFAAYQIPIVTIQ